jgi:uncharacterized membrane protein YhaH (DUF805 family)
MTFLESIRSGFAHYADFKGRARVSEFWWWQLFSIIGLLAAYIADAAITPDAPLGPIAAVFHIGTLLPSVAVLARRLHDIDKTAWWSILALTVIGSFVLLYWTARLGTPGPNRFGPDPLGADDEGLRSRPSGL